MPEDCFKFKAIDADFTLNDDMVRQEELKLVAELGDPFENVFNELKTSKAVVDADRATDLNVEGLAGSSELDTSFSEGSQFDFF